MPPGFFDEVFKVFPRQHNLANLSDAIAGVLRCTPHTTYLCFMADIGRRQVKGFDPPNSLDIKRRPPFDD